MKYFLLSLILAFTCSYASANRIYTVCDGDWNNAVIWQGGTIPAAGDSIYIVHNVELTADLLLNDNFLSIDSASEVCGLYTLTVDGGSYVVVDGTFKLQTVNLNDFMIVNGTVFMNQLVLNGYLVINGAVVVGWNGVCNPPVTTCVPPSSAFLASSTTLCVGECVNFTDLSQNTPTGWSWQFSGSTTPTSTDQNPQNICYSTPGIYDVTLIATNSIGSDSLMMTQYIIVNDSSSNTISDTSCSSYVSPSGNYNWTSSGTYTDILVNAMGCDSILTIDLIVLSTYATLIDTFCQSYVSPSGNYSWTSSGTYMDTVPNSAGCDSIITVNLTSLSSAATLNEAVCESYTSPSGNYTWSSAGTYMDTILNTAGCDSVITITLIILENSSSINEFACGTYTVPSGDETYTVTGTYLDTISNSFGCDSLITVNLTIANSNSSFIVDTLCGTYSFPSGGTTSLSGTYLDTVENTAGCDSVITFSLTIYPFTSAGFTGLDEVYCIDDIGITDTLIGIPSGGTFYGPGISGNVFNPFLSGFGTFGISYSFTNEFGCKDSLVQNVTVNSCTGIAEQDFIRNMVIYPNPSEGEFTLEMNLSEIETIEVEITNVLGQKVFQLALASEQGRLVKIIDLGTKPPGVYTVQVKTEKGTINRQLIIQ